MNAIRTAEFVDVHATKLRVLFGSLLVITGIYVAALLVSTIHIDNAAPTASNDASEQQVTADVSYDPNVVTGGMSLAIDNFKRNMSTTGAALNNSTHSFQVGAVHGANAIVQTGVFGARAVQNSGTAVAQIGTNSVSMVQHGAVAVATATVHGVGGSLAFIVRAPGNALGWVSNSPVVSALIKPADRTAVPTADSAGSAVMAAQIALLSESSASPVDVVVAPTPAPTPPPIVDNEGAWPIHGAITTQFGVPELPYQAIHTGLDISDGNRSGTTPIRAFRAGRVIEVVHSALGLGNHVVVDHGGGLTSVYGHMYATSVQVGQPVDKQTVLGFEGSTGVSTGAHLHFEIRLNGQAMDPHKYISGQPYL